jgi:hypothetical protein
MGNFQLPVLADPVTYFSTLMDTYSSSSQILNDFVSAHEACLWHRGFKTRSSCFLLCYVELEIAVQGDFARFPLEPPVACSRQTYIELVMKHCLYLSHTSSLSK